MEIHSVTKKPTVICHIHGILYTVTQPFLVSLLIWLTLTLWSVYLHIPLRCLVQSTGDNFYQSLSFASEPRILSVCLGDEGDFPGHLGVIDPSAIFKVLTLSLSAGLLKVTLALYCFNDAIIGQKPV